MGCYNTRAPTVLSAGSVQQQPSANALIRSAVARQRCARNWGGAELAQAFGPKTGTRKPSTGYLTSASVTRNRELASTPGAAWGWTRASVPRATLIRSAPSGVTNTAVMPTAACAAAGGTANTRAGAVAPKGG